ncbi:MAG: two-component sensor histidine kinase [Actinobacteria bacterium]|nr:two-component sensor histidine kinase [Actinomycetota bacterium]
MRIALAGDECAIASPHRELDYPLWVGWLTSGVVVGFAVLVTVFRHDAVSVHPAAVALVWASTVPWLLQLTGRTLPRPAFIAGVVIPQALLHVGGRALGIATLLDEDHTQAALMIVVFAAGEIAATSRWRDTITMAIAAVAIILGRNVVQPEFDGGVFWVGGAVVALAMGYVMRRQAAVMFQLRVAQGALAEEEVVKERQRIAREVHDVIAHTMTVTMMHLTAARLHLRKDPDAAEDALLQAERLGRQSLRDIHRTVGLLRAEPPDGIDRPQPEARDIEPLVEAYRSAGTDVRLRIDGELGELAPSTGLAVYRIAQESLTNASRHAPGSLVTVTLTTNDGHGTLEIGNPVPSGGTAKPAGGLGILGMRERANLVGGSLEAGVEDGRWIVRCRFPLAAPLARESVP